MSPENKQRVVGVIVLVAFVALLIPFLFTSGVKKKHELATDEIAIPAETANVNQASDMPPVSPGMQQPGLSQESSQNAPVVTPEGVQLPSSALSPEHAEKGNMFPEGNQGLIPESGSEQQKTATPLESNPAVAPVAAVETPTAVSEPTIPKTVVKSKKHGAKSKMHHKGKIVAKGAPILWSVQVGSFSDQTRMQNMVNKLQAKGYHVYLQKITTSHGMMVRVLVGRETTKAKAIKIANQLKTKLKIDGRVVGNKK